MQCIGVHSDRIPSKKIMARNFRTLLLIFALLHTCLSKTRTEIGRNFCASNATQPDDNLSCPSGLVGGQDCLRVAQLCDGVNDCGDGSTGSDEGDTTTFNLIECKASFKCMGMEWYDVSAINFEKSSKILNCNYSAAGFRPHAGALCMQGSYYS